jgi:hypothetical protein
LEESCCLIFFHITCVPTLGFMLLRPGF